MVMVHGRRCALARQIAADGTKIWPETQKIWRDEKLHSAIQPWEMAKPKQYRTI
jgi:hypothetical protein